MAKLAEMLCFLLLLEKKVVHRHYSWCKSQKKQQINRFCNRIKKKPHKLIIFNENQLISNQ
jgi:hypothetical protein